jgi:MoxR-like ATPase
MATDKKKSNVPIWELIDLVQQHAQRILYYGPPGTGKTFRALRQESAKQAKAQPVYAITITPEMPAAELRGHYIPVGGNFEWKDGPAILAWRNGGRLVINEIDHATGDVLSFLHNLLDDPEFAVMTLPTGETVRPAKGFQVIATMNGEPRDLPEALRSRFPVTIEITQPNPEAIAALPEDLRNAARGSCVADKEEARINLRRWYEYANLRKVIGEQHAAQAVFGARASAVLTSLKVASAPSA